MYYFLPKTTILSGMIPKGSKKKGSKKKGSKGKIQKGGGGPWTVFAGVVGIILTVIICFWGSSSPGDIGGCMLLALGTIVVTVMFYLVEGDTEYLKAKTVQGPPETNGGSE